MNPNERASKARRESMEQAQNDRSKAEEQAKDACDGGMSQAFRAREGVSLIY